MATIAEVTKLAWTLRDHANEIREAVVQGEREAVERLAAEAEVLCRQIVGTLRRIEEPSRS